MKKRKQVNPSVYTKKYYLSDCTGYKEFKKNYGKVLEPRLNEIVKYIPISSGLKVLDIGCGRGELAFWAAEKGADVIGIDYSKDAIELAKKALDKRKSELKGKVKFMLLDAYSMNFPNNSFDLIIMTEVLEHLYQQEQYKILKKSRQLLKTRGTIFIHTAPSKTFNDITYKYWCHPVSSLIVNLSNFITNNKYGNIPPWKKIRSSSHKIMHVNEPTYMKLIETINKCGLKGKIMSTNITVLKPAISWKDNLYNALVYLYPLSKYPPFNIVWGNDFISLLRKK